MKSLKSLLKSASFYRRALIMLVIILILIRPNLSSETVNRGMTNLNIWFAVDATGSMVAKDVEDGNKRRFEKVKEDITEIVTHSRGAKYALIAQDYSSYVASPLSPSTESIVSAEAYVSPKYSLYSKPSNLTELLNYTLEKIKVYKTRRPERSNILVFMSDGEDVSSTKLTIPTEFNSILDGVIIFGYGSINGSKIEEIGGSVDGEWDTGAIMENRFVKYFGEDKNIETDALSQVISKINENNLRQISDNLGGIYYHRENGAIDNLVFSTIDRIAIQNSSNMPEEESVNVGGETYWIFAILLLVLLLWECRESLLRILLERERSNA